MTVAGWAQIVIFIAVLTALTPLLGGYMSKVYQGQRVALSPLAAPVERLTYRILRPPNVAARPGGPAHDTPTFVVFLVGFVIVFALLNFLAALCLGPLDQSLTPHLYG